MTATDGPIFHVEPKEDLGSRMFQYLVALCFRAQVPDCRISNVRLAEWGIDHPPLELQHRIEWAGIPHHIEMAGLAERARSGHTRTVVYTGFGQRLENFPDLDTCRAAFRPSVACPARFGEGYVVCHVRAPKILDQTREASSPLTPAGFFAEVVARTGLVPVFVGPASPGEYAEHLRERFPHGVFLDPGDPMLDFDIIRQARSIALGVSSFAWLAAWLSHAEQIFMAVSGRLHPLQDRLIDLLPFTDARYQFYLLPINYAVPPHRQLAVHDRIAPLLRCIPADRLQRLFRDAPHFDPTSEQMLQEFDPDYYRAKYDDVAGRFTAADAWQHYWENGAREGRQPFRLSSRWYAERYPMAAFEVAQGDYSSFAHHYVAVGRHHGYRPLPDAATIAEWPDAVLDDATPHFAPSIDELADEVLTIEEDAPLHPQAAVSLGDSFHQLLTAEKASHFVRMPHTGRMRIYRLRDVMLDTSMMALFKGRQPIRETLYMMTQADYEHALVKPLHPEATNVAQHYILASNASVHNYFHWMTQSLPAIDWGVRRRRQAQVALAVPPLQPRQAEALALLGYADMPRLALRQAAHYALASAEYAEFLGARMEHVASHAAADTWRRLCQSVAPAADGADTIYVARTDTRQRVALNEPDLIAMLERQGVRIVVPGALPVVRQLAIFRRARLVIGPHGAGLTNIIACGPGTHVYELVPSHYPNSCYNHVAQSCGLYYWGDVFPGKAAEGDPDGGTWCIDLDLVARRLDEIRAVIAAEGACSR